MTTATSRLSKKSISAVLDAIGHAGAAYSVEPLPGSYSNFTHTLRIEREGAEPRQIVVVGPGGARGTRDSLRRLWSVPAENAVVLLADSRGTRESGLPAVRAAQEAGPEDGGTTFLPCRGGVCSLPVANVEAACDYLRS